MAFFLPPFCYGQSPPTTKKAGKEISFLGGTEWLHTCGPHLVAISRKDEVCLWEWTDLQKPPLKGRGEDGLAAAFLLPNLIISTVDPLRNAPQEKKWMDDATKWIRQGGKGPPPPRPPSLGQPIKDPNKDTILIKTMETGEELRRWEIGPEWYCKEMRTSTNGTFVVILTNQNSNVTHTPGESRVRVGILGSDLDKGIRWAPEIREKKGSLYVSRSVPSEDGRFVATVGVNNGSWICLVEVGQMRVTWDFVDDMSVGFEDAAFSPDSQTVYAAGGSGILYAFDVTTGQVKSKWLIGDGKQAEYGNRISCVAASPDGRLVAAGTGPDGKVYIWDTGTGNRVDVLQTKQATIMGLAFSPDSTRLAVTGVANQTIEVWDVKYEFRGSSGEFREFRSSGDVLRNNTG